MIFINFLKRVIVIGNIIAFSFFLAVLINSYIAIKSFKLPENMNIDYKKVKSKEKKFSYDFIDDIFLNIEKESFTENKSLVNQTNQYRKSIQNLKNAKLIGTLIFNKKRLALVKYNGETFLLKEGEFFKGYQVKKVEKHKIILEKANKLYQISMETESYQSKKTFTKQLDTETEKSIIKISKSVVEKETSDIGNLLKDVRLIPIVRNGETVGFKFTYIKPTSPLYKYGLRSGDIIKSVNGMPVRTAEEAFKIYNMLRNESKIEVEIERRGKRKVIVYEIQ